MVPLHPLGLPAMALSSAVCCWFKGLHVDWTTTILQPPKMFDTGTLKGHQPQGGATPQFWTQTTPQLTVGRRLQGGAGGLGGGVLGGAIGGGSKGLLPRGGGSGRVGFWGGGQDGRFGGYMPPTPSVGRSQAREPPLALPQTIPSPQPLQRTDSAMPAMLIGLNKIPQSSFMATFATSLLSISDLKKSFDPSLGLELGLGSPSWWNQSWFYNPF